VPVTGYVCTCDREFSKEALLDHLSNRGTGCDMTYELASSILEQIQDRGDRISTTTLTSKCLRSTSLQRHFPFTESLAGRWASFRGTMYHGQLEYHSHPRSIAEARYHMELDGLGPFSGSPDLVDVPQGVLYDYKTNKENPRYAYPWADHVEQVNVNRWLVDNATSVEWQGETYELSVADNKVKFVPDSWHSLVLVYIDDRGAKPLACTRSEKVKCQNGNYRNARVPDIWTDDKVEELVRRKYALAKEALQPGAAIPPVPPGFENWAHPLCGFCPVKQHCIEAFITQRVEEERNTQLALV